MPKKFIKSLNYAKIGAQHALLTQRNIWIHLSIGVLVIAAAVWLKISLAQTAILVLTITFVVVLEMLNTALEEIVNLLKPEKHPLAALAKNIAAAAVLTAAVGAAIVGLLIFIPKIL